MEVLGLPPRTAVARGLVSAVLQSGGLLKDFTVGETVELTASLFASARPVDEVLDRAGIGDLGDRRVGKCSGGQQQRLRFAMALLPDPELIILDEPTTGMDVAGRRDFWSAIRQDAAHGRTVVFATHYLEEADAYADRIVLMSKGNVVADGSAAAIKEMASRSDGARHAGPVPTSTGSAPCRGWSPSTSVATASWSVAADSDLVARSLLTSTDAHDLEITAHNLEDAFVALTEPSPVPRRVPHDRHRSP